jgi:ribosome silencing factor RsfS/YbeB/iojap
LSGVSESLVKNANARNEELKNTIIAALEDLKAVDITVISVADSSSVTDWMVIATGTSNRHVKALASNVEFDGKKYGFKTIGSEGNETAEPVGQCRRAGAVGVWADASSERGGHRPRVGGARIPSGGEVEGRSDPW